MTERNLITGDFSTGEMTLGNSGTSAGAFNLATLGTRIINIGSSNSTTTIRGLSSSPTYSDEAASKAYVDKMTNANSSKLGQIATFTDADSDSTYDNASDVATLKTTTKISSDTTISDIDTVFEGTQATGLTGITSTGTTSVATLSTSGNTTVGGALGVTGTTTTAGITDSGTIAATTLTASGSTTISGILTADTIKDSSGNSVIRRDSSTGAIHIGTNSMIFDDAAGSIGNGTDIMSSSEGKIQIGKNTTDTTTIVGSLSIQDPTSDEHAVTRRYVDKLAAISAVLDTRMPANGKTSRVMLNAATVHNQAAIGLSAVGLFEDDTKRIWDYSLGIATSSGETMSKASIGFSW
jgi:hypothetical protein